MIRRNWKTWIILKGKGFDVEYDWEVRFKESQIFYGIRLLSILIIERSVKIRLSQWNLETWAES